MNPIKLSVILPCYNVEQYIAVCLDSLYAQDIPETEYEVICVNDCSPDNGRSIVLEYQKQHKNLMLIDHDVNKKQGGARNSGLKIATGKYIWFVDPDDFVENNVFNKLVTIIEENNLDILHFNAKKINENKILSDYFYFPGTEKVITGIEYLKDDRVPYWKRQVTPWSKLYKKEFLTQNRIVFPENVFLEDNVHSLLSLLHCTRFFYLNDFIYYYRQNESSTMNQNVLGGAKLADRVRYEVECVSILEKWKNIDHEVSSLIIPMYRYHLINRKKSLLKMSLTELNAFYKGIKSIDKNNFIHQLSFKDNFIYRFPYLILLLTTALAPVFWFSRNLKWLISKFRV
ncbi:MAG: glycosyltransferase [Paludibacter sp.]|nr:glycosyltransferase [Paludibacter sp.]